MPLYLEIRDDIRRLIDEGVYRRGERIPADAQLAERYDVSLPTVRRAVDLLVEDGYLQRRPRRGTVVSQGKKIDQAFTGSILTYDDEMHQNGSVPKTQVILQRVVGAEGGVAKALEVPEGTPAMRLVRLRYADDLPNVFVSSLVPLDVLPGIEQEDFSKASLYNTMRRMGTPVTHLWRKAEVVPASDEIATLLDEEPGEPIFFFRTVARGSAGRVLEYSRSYYRGQTNGFDFNERFVYGEFGGESTEHQEP